MKLKHQMRGLGVGIIVTALLMGVATREKIPLSDAEIKAKALALGMVESDSLKLTDIQNMAQPSGTTPEPADGSHGGENVPENGAGNPDGSAPSEGAENPEGSAASGTEGNPDGSVSSQGEENADDSVMPDGVENSDSTSGTVIIHIASGLSSYDASVIIAEAGLVENATAFDRYLCTQGYSRKVADGTYEIPVGATEEEIAKIITKGR